MEVKINELKNCEREMIITIDSQEASKDYNKVLKKFKNYVMIPGFRKGKAPLNMVERKYGDHAKEEFYNQKIGDYYQKALQEKEINPVNMGEPTNIEWKKGKDLKATFKFEVMPEIEIEKYKDLEVPYEKTEFKKDMIDGTLEEYQNQLAKEIDVETAKESDKITVSVKFLDDDDKVTKEIDREFVLNDNPYCKSFNKKVEDSKVGDEFKAKLFTKSQESKDEDITDKFKDREFGVEIKSIKRKELPELNDDFAKDLEYDSLDDLKVKIEEELKVKIKKDDKQKLKQALISKVLEVNPFEVPKSIVKKYAEDMAKPSAEQYNIELDKIVPMYEQMAEFNLKSHYAIEELKKQEKVEVSEEEIEAMISEAAENLNMEVEKYKKMYKKQIESDQFKYAAQEKKIIDILEKNSKFVPYPKEDKKDSKEEK